MIRLKAFVILIAISFLVTGCILKRDRIVSDEQVEEKYADTSVVNALQKTTRAMAKAKIENLDRYAPSYMSEADRALMKARNLYRKQAEKNEILAFVYIADDNLNKAKQVKDLVKRQLSEVYTYLNNHYTGHSPSAARKLIELLSD